MKHDTSSPASGPASSSTRQPVLQPLGVSCDGPLSANEGLEVEAPGVSCDGPLSAPDEVLPPLGVSCDGPLSATEELEMEAPEVSCNGLQSANDELHVEAPEERCKGPPSAASLRASPGRTPGGATLCRRRREWLGAPAMGRGAVGATATLAP